MVMVTLFPEHDTKSVLRASGKVGPWPLGMARENLYSLRDAHTYIGTDGSTLR